MAPRVPSRSIRRAQRVQDGHSLGEHLILTTLWNQATPTYETLSVRRVTIGYRTLSELCGLTVNNCKNNLRSLQRKLAIEVIQSHSNSTATTYLVYEAAEILRRREAAGLTHVVRTKGVQFVDPSTGSPVKGIPGMGVPE